MTLDKIIKISRYVQIGHSKGKYTIDANIWLKDISMYTANIRGTGNSLEEAVESVQKKLSKLDVLQVKEA
jgi:hypothetical protein